MFACNYFVNFHFQLLFSSNNLFRLRKKTDGAGKYLTEMELTDVSESKPPPQPPTTHQPHKKRLAALPPKVLDPQFVPEPPMGTDRPFLPMTNIYEVSERRNLKYDFTNFIPLKGN